MLLLLGFGFLIAFLNATANLNATTNPYFATEVKLVYDAMAVAQREHRTRQKKFNALRLSLLQMNKAKRTRTSVARTEVRQITRRGGVFCVRYGNHRPSLTFFGRADGRKVGRRYKQWL